MSEELDTFPTLPNLNATLQMRINQTKTIESPLPPPGTIDPYQLLLQRQKQAKQGETAPIDPVTIQKWPEEDVKELEDYCKRMGVMGFASRMNPKLALIQLKRQLGDYSGVPLEERIPDGYEKVGTVNKYGPNYPYSEAIRKKQILHG